ncbi:MAG: SLC13 family permease [Sulfolobales archaeon]
MAEDPKVLLRGCGESSIFKSLIISSAYTWWQSLHIDLSLATQRVYEIQRLFTGFLIIAILIFFLIFRSRYAKIPIWSAMAFTSFLTVSMNLVSIDEIGSLIDLDVILFLIGMFSLVGMAEESGLLDAISLWFISRFRTLRSLIIASSLVFGLLAAFAMNDTVALMGPPIAYSISRVAGVDPGFMFLLLAFSLTIGSVMTPIGNPQNVLIAEGSEIPAPFINFIYRLALPTIINLVLTPIVLMRLRGIKDKRRVIVVAIPEEVIRDRREAVLAATGLVITITGLVINDVLQLMSYPHIQKRGFIPFIVAAGIYIFSRDPRKTLSKVDWGTIVFFISMFITMEGVWRSGVLNPLLSTLAYSKHGDYRDIISIAAASIIISQVLSNVPFTKLFITYMKHLGFTGEDINAWISLATFSTIAGNLTPLGAASNIIIMEVLETRYSRTITFKEFITAGSVITILNSLIYLIFLAFF